MRSFKAKAVGHVRQEALAERYKNSEALITRVKRELVVAPMIPESGKGLDIGCRDGRYTKYLKGLELTSIDIDPRDMEKLKAEGHGKFIVADVQQMPFPGNSFDFVLFSEVLEHVPDQKKALKEIARVLRPGGKVLITTPSARYPATWDFSNWLRGLLGRQPKRRKSVFTNWTPDHKRLYTYSGLREDVSSVLEVEKAIASGRVFTPFLQAAWLPFYAIVKACRKLRLGFVARPLEKLFWLFIKVSIREDCEKDVPCLTLIVLARKR